MGHFLFAGSSLNLPDGFCLRTKETKLWRSPRTWPRRTRWRCPRTSRWAANALGDATSQCGVCGRATFSCLWQLNNVMGFVDTDQSVLDSTDSGGRQRRLHHRLLHGPDPNSENAKAHFYSQLQLVSVVLLFISYFILFFYHRDFWMLPFKKCTTLENPKRKQKHLVSRWLSARWVLNPSHPLIFTLNSKQTISLVLFGDFIQ